MTARKTGYNSTFAIGGVRCSADTFVVAESSVFRINIYAKNPARTQICRPLAPILRMTEQTTHIDVGQSKILNLDADDQGNFIAFTDNKTVVTNDHNLLLVIIISIL